MANSESLRIPRRPEWNENMTRSELDVAERESFLEWRRKIVEYVPHMAHDRSINRSLADTPPFYEPVSSRMRTWS